jgi:hypothetical protein
MRPTSRGQPVIELTSEGGKLLQFALRILQLNDETYASTSDDLPTGSVRPACHRLNDKTPAWPCCPAVDQRIGTRHSRSAGQ